MAKIMSEDYFESIEGGPDCPLLLLCDHASNALPAHYGSLGLPQREFARHIAYDIGARDVTLKLAARFNAPALLTRYSRLLLDPNRGLDDPTLIMQLSDGAVVPGNLRLPVAERQARIDRYHQPYHSAIAAKLDGMLARGITPFIVSMHSFTPSWKGWPRPWHVGVLWDRDDRLAAPMIKALEAMPGICVGDNEPYSGALEGDTLTIHGTERGIAHVLIEVRQDLIADETGVDEWADRLAQAIEPFMTQGQRTG